MEGSEAPERSTAFSFTINTPVASDYANVRHLTEKPGILQVIGETEVGSETGTTHIQGYCRFDHRIYRSTLSRWLDGNAHIEKSKGSPAQNYTYCTKTGDIFVDYGFEAIKEREAKISKKEKRDEKAREILVDIHDLTETEFALKHTSFYLYHKKDFCNFKVRYDMEAMKNYDGLLSDKNYWLVGSAGSGKSKLPDSWTDPKFICRKTSNKWFDGYETFHQIIVLDDLQPGLNEQSARNLKNLADRYKFVVEVKNSSKVISPDDFCLIVTTNYSIEEIFPNPVDHEPIKRRFHFFNVDEVNQLGAQIDPPPYLETIKARNMLPAGEDLITALKRIGEEAREASQRASQAQSSVPSQIKSQRLSQLSQAQESRNEKVTQRRIQKSQSSQSSVSSQTEDWRMPDPPRYQPSEVEITKFSDATPSESESDSGVEYDCQRNHSQSIKGRDKLLELLNKSSSETEEEESTEIDLDTSSE